MAFFYNCVLWWWNLSGPKWSLAGAGGAGGATCAAGASEATCVAGASGATGAAGSVGGAGGATGGGGAGEDAEAVCAEAGISDGVWGRWFWAEDCCDDVWASGTAWVSIFSILALFASLNSLLRSCKWKKNKRDLPIYTTSQEQILICLIFT